MVRQTFFAVRPAHVRDLEISLDATRAVSVTLTEAGGTLATNRYSRMGIRIYPRTCTYWFHVSLDVVAETCDGQGRCVTATEGAGSVNSAYLPRHTVSDDHLILEGSGYFEAHGTGFARTGYDDVFYPNDNHITDNGNLDRAFVTWRFWPLATLGQPGSPRSGTRP